MNRLAVWFAFVLILSPCVALAKDFCIQLDDNGDVLVVKGGVRKGSKGVSGHYAQFTGISNGVPVYLVQPLAGSAILASDRRFVMGLTQYVLGLSQSGSLWSDSTIFHHVTCNPGADGKLNAPDMCADLTNANPIPDQENRPAHVVDCGVANAAP